MAELSIVDIQRQPDAAHGKNPIGCPGCNQWGENPAGAIGKDDGVNDKIGKADTETDADPHGDAARPATAQGKGYPQKSHDQRGKRIGNPRMHFSQVGCSVVTSSPQLVAVAT